MNTTWGNKQGEQTTSQPAVRENNTEILIKREPLVHTTARRAVQRKKEKKKARTVQQQ